MKGISHGSKMGILSMKWNTSWTLELTRERYGFKISSIKSAKLTVGLNFPPKIILRDKSLGDFKFKHSSAVDLSFSFISLDLWIFGSP